MALLVTLPGCIAAASSLSLTPSVILKSPASYDRQVLTVYGRVSHLTASPTGERPAYRSYQLCDTVCIPCSTTGARRSKKGPPSKSVAGSV